MANKVIPKTVCLSIYGMSVISNVSYQTRYGVLNNVQLLGPHCIVALDSVETIYFASASVAVDFSHNYDCVIIRFME